MKNSIKKIRKIWLLDIVFLLSLGGIAISQEFDYVMGTDYYPEPTLQMPEKGAWFEDPTFHTRIVRVSDKTIDGIPEDPCVIIPEGARSSPENADGSYILLTFAEYALFLYDAKTFEHIKPLNQVAGGKIPDNIDGPNEARWDCTDPNVFYYVYRMGFYKYDVSTDMITLIHDFSNEYPGGRKVHNDVEGEPSWDTRYWAFIVSGLEAKLTLITYDKEEDRIIGSMDAFADINTVSISPYGDRVLVENMENYGVSYALDFTDPVRLGAQGHSDLAIDADGNQVHVIKDDSYDCFAMIDLKTGKRTNLMNLPLTGSWNGEPGHHISGSNYATPGWVVISTYDGDTSKWPYCQIFMLELKQNPRIWRIAHTHTLYGGGGEWYYWSEPRATINRKGTKIWWGSNWGHLAGDIDTYQATLPETWWRDMGGGPVSVGLRSFEATVVGNAVQLTWQTASETSNLGFEIERSSHGSSFEKIGFARGHGATGMPRSYEFLDETVKEGTYYYRLKQLDSDGSFKYSSQVVITINFPKEFELEQNYPNPFNPSTEIVYHLPAQTHIHLTIYDILGQEIKTLVDDVQQPGIRKTKWNGTDSNGISVAWGIYICRLEADDFTLAKKMLLLP